MIRSEISNCDTTNMFVCVCVCVCLCVCVYDKMVLLNLVQVFKNNQLVCGIAVNFCYCLKNIIVE
jgi:ABC-type uncharacterized transport system permease subunit